MWKPVVSDRLLHPARAPAFRPTACGHARPHDGLRAWRDVRDGAAPFGRVARKRPSLAAKRRPELDARRAVGREQRRGKTDSERRSAHHQEIETGDVELERPPDEI